jgi:hypothetical protein
VISVILRAPLVRILIMSASGPAVSAGGPETTRQSQVVRTGVPARGRMLLLWLSIICLR